MMKPIEASPSPQAELSFGLMRINGALLALPVEAIREVVPGRSTYAPLPAWTQGVSGAINLRGSVIPVFDARQALGMVVSPLGNHVILIMRWEGRLLGLIADQVCGMAKIARDNLFKLDVNTVNALPLLATHAFQFGDDIASLLDAARIAALPNLPTTLELVAQKGAGQAQAMEQILLFNFGRWHLGIEAVCVAATVPSTTIERNALAGGYCLGIIDHHGYEVPVVDTAAALGLGSPSRVTKAPIVIVRFTEEAMIGFAIDEVRDIAKVPLNRILPMPTSGIGDTSFFRGLLSDEAKLQHLVIDAGRLRADTQLMGLAALRKPRLGIQTTARAGTHANGGKGSQVSQAFLTYTTGGERASPLDQVTEIVPFPTNYAPFEAATVGLLGLFTHRDRAIPLVCLATRYGNAASMDQDRARVLVVTLGVTTMGFVVDSLRSIELSQWSSQTAGSNSADRTPLGSLVLIGLGEDRRMVQSIDLFAEVWALSQVFRKDAPDNMDNSAVDALLLKVDAA